MKLSLHFGLNRVDPRAYNDWPGLLNACENDAVGLARVLTRRGFRARVACSGQCTQAAFINEVVRMAEAAQSGDLVIISFSGHGGQQYSLTEPDGYNETLCFYDGQMLDDDFVRLLGNFKAGVNVIVILDCCHAAGEDREAFGPAKRVLPENLWLRREGKKSATPRSPINASEVLFCACREDETASDGKENGAWTGALLSALPPQSVNVRAWLDRAAGVCPHNQHPVIETLGPAGVLDKIV